MNRQSAANLIMTLSVDLFDLAYDDGTYVLRDKRLDIVTELINLLFKDVLTNDESENSSIDVKSIKVSKKQNEALQYWMYVISQVVLSGRFNTFTQLDIESWFASILTFLEAQNSDDDVVFNQSIFNKPRLEIRDEIVRARYRPSGIKGIGVCIKCKSEELHRMDKQVRGLDEPMSIFYSCINCGASWRVG